MGRLRLNTATGLAEILPIRSDGRVAIGGAALPTASGSFVIQPGEAGRHVVQIQGSLNEPPAAGSVARVVLDNVVAGKVDPGDERDNYVVTTFAGTAGVQGNAAGPKGVGRLNQPKLIETVTSRPGGDELVVADQNGLWRVSPEGNLSVISIAAGIQGLCVVQRNAYITTSSHTIHKVNIDTRAFTIIGSTGSPGNVAGSGSTARLNNPMEIGASYVFDANGYRPFNTASDFVSLPSLSVVNVERYVRAPSGAGWAGAAMLATIGSNFLSMQDSTISSILSVGGASAGLVNGSGSAARFSQPQGFDFLQSRLYVADTGNNVIRSVVALPNGMPTDYLGYYVTTVAGSGQGFQDGPGSTAKFDTPVDITTDTGYDEFYVADKANHCIRRVSKSARLSGTVGVSGTVTQPPLFPTAHFLPNPAGGTTPYFPAEFAGSNFQVTFDVIVPQGANVIEADISLEVQPEHYSALEGVLDLNAPLVGSAGNRVRTIAGRTGAAGFADGPGSGAAFALELGIATDAQGNAYIADRQNGVIRRLTRDNVVKTIIGDPFNSSGAPVNGDGTVEAGLPTDLAVTPDGNTIWWTDSINHVVRRGAFMGATENDKNDPTKWQVVTLYGLAATQGDAIGTGTSAKFRFPSGICYDPRSKMVYVADTGNHRIKKFYPELPGPIQNFTGVGSPSTTSLNSPTDVVVAPDGNVYVTDTLNRVIRKVLPNGTPLTLAGSVGVGVLEDGATGVEALFSTLGSLTVDNSGYLYVFDKSAGGVIRRVSTLTGETKTCVGNSGNGAIADGDGSQASLAASSASLAMLPGGDLIMGNASVIREIHRIVADPAP